MACAGILRLLISCKTGAIVTACVLAIWVGFPVLTFAEDATSCQLGAGETVNVCFANPPLLVNHCDGTILPDFQISRKDDVPYYFTFRVFADLGGGDVSLFDQPTDVGRGTGENVYLLTDKDAVTQAGVTYLTIPFKGSGSYYIEVTVYAKGLAPVTKTSARIGLEDHPLIKSVVVGVSQYDNGGDTASGKPVMNLRHADSDAKAFAGMLSQLFPDSPSPVLLTSDKAAPTALPTPDNIMTELSNAVKDPGLCADNDWFIFYFSGHGVLSSDGRNIRHYVSTKSLNPSDLPSTAIWIGDLLPKIEHVRAGNKLVVLDSCFSGTTRAPDASPGSSGKGVKILRRSSPYSSKVQFVVNGKTVDAFQAVNDPDAYAPTDFMTRVDHARGRALFLAAAKSDHEAEEGFEKTTSAGAVEFTPSDTESEEQKQSGHGLYTFFLVWKLESQLPKGAKYKEVLGGNPPVVNSGDQCALDFVAARDMVNGEFVNKITRTSGSDLQKPDYIQTPQDLPPVKCILTSSDGGSDALPNQ